MPHFSPTGHDMCLCQICHRDVDTGAEKMEWRKDVTANQSAGNVCPPCMLAHASTGKVGDALREHVRGGGSNRSAARQDDGPISVYEHAAQESGLSGQALRAYVNRYYGHG
jgi:hypothetical protein